MRLESKQFQVTVTDEALLKNSSVEHIKSGHEVLTLEYQGVILVQHRFYCQVCEKHPNKVFMVTNELWEQSELDGFICHECFQSRMGRKFELSDLTPASCNDWLKWKIVESNLN